MNIEKQPIENHEITLNVSVSAEEFQPFKQQAARKISGRNKIAGFRPGKAPYAMIERMYGNEAIAQEALDIFLEKEYGHLIDEAGIQPGGMGNLTKVDSFDPPVFTVVIPLVPEVDLGDYRDIREAYEEPVVSDEDYEGTLNELRTNYATAEPTDDPIENGHQVNAIVSITRVEVDPETGSNTLVNEMPYDFEIGKDTERGFPYAGYTKELIGKKAGEVVTTNYTFGDDAPIEKMQGVETVIKTTVQGVKKRVLPELDLEFTKNFGEYETLEAFTDDVKARIKEAKVREYENDYIEALTKKLVETAKIDFAPAALEEEAQSLFNDFSERIKQQGLDLETYFKMMKTDAEKFLNEEVRPQAESQLKRRLVIEKFARVEKIQLNFEKFKENVAALEQSAAYEYMQAKTKKAKEAITNRVTNQAMNQAFSDSIFDRLIAIAKGENPPIEPVVNEDAVIEESVNEDVTVSSDEVITPNEDTAI